MFNTNGHRNQMVSTVSIIMIVWLIIHTWDIITYPHSQEKASFVMVVLVVFVVVFVAVCVLFGVVFIVAFVVVVLAVVSIVTILK
jgi:hypothetical protein